ncbi:MAG TPA: protein kinase [Rhodanobacteraceae bacterium]|nr:protein kinase [Rhodanobacteraceae bacterium]
MIGSKRLWGSLLALLLAVAAVLGAAPAPERLALRGAEFLTPRHVPSADVVVVGIGADDLARIGDWPWPRDLIAAFTDKLVADRARVIAYVPAFDTAQNAQALASLQRLGGSGDMRRALETDARFAASLRRAGNVLLGAHPVLQGERGTALPATAVLEPRKQDFLRRLFDAPMASVRAPLPMLAARADGIGFVADGVHTAAQALAVRVNGQLLPSLALLTAARARGVGNDKLSLHALGGITLGKLEVPTDARLRAVARTYRNGDASLFPAYGFGDAYDGTLAPDSLRGKVVLVGLMEQGADAPVLRVADMVSSILNQEVIATPFWGAWLRGLVVLGVCAWLGFGLARFGRVAALSLSVVWLVLIANLEFIPLLARGVWLPLAAPFALLLFGHLLWLAWRALHSHAGINSIELSEANRQLGLAYQQLGRYDDAFDSFRRCRPSTALCEAMQHLAQDHERHRRYADAIRVYDEIERIAPGFDDVAAHLEQLRQFETTPTLMGARRNGARDMMFSGNLQKPMLGRYQLVKEIGRGAMGVVYLGRDPKIGRTVAIKTMSLADEFDGRVLEEISQRFYREAETAGRLNHPNIVTIYDVGDDQGLAYIAMDFLSGEPLENYAAPGKLLPLAEALSIVVKVADALAYAHTQNVVHRDIKPANLMYERESGRLKITDFGIAALTDVSKTRTGTILGSPSYMSPEQIAGRRVDGRSDLYSLGVTFYQLLRGEVPFEATSLTGLMYKIANEPHPDVTFLRPDIPAILKTVIDKALQKNAGDRYQTGADMASALRDCQSRLKSGR